MTDIPFRHTRPLHLLLFGVACITLFALAVPNFHSGPCRGGHNETAAISTLRNLHSAQEQFREACRVDEDGDGVGEYGTFLELSGAATLRGYAASPEKPIESDGSEDASIESDSAPEIEPEEAESSPAPC